MATIAVLIIVFIIVFGVILSIRNKWRLWPIILCVLLVLFAVLSFHFCTDEEKLPGGFVYNSQRKDIIGRFDIPSTITRYDINDDFIFIEQIPKYPIQAIYNIEYYDYRQNEGRLFWIIDTKRAKPIGPIDSATFYKYKDSILFSENQK